jgi:Flp pilus assembly protein TadD
LAAAREDVDDLSGIELVERLVCGNGEFDANAAELALASMKLWPSDRARMNVGVQYMFDSVYELALTTFHELVERRPPAWLVAVAWTNIGFVYESTGRSGEALSAYVTAGRFDETRFMPPMAAFATALQLGNRRAAAGAAHLVEERTREEPVAVDEFIAMQRARPRDIERAMVIIRTLDSIEGRLGPATEAIGRAML